LREKMTRGLATSEEMSRLNWLARMLKGRR